ncbi:hypothetical protein [Methylomonas sp.]|jgi:hypothetical protein|nr:hypothetical protein [Methylomonas sp.]
MTLSAAKTIDASGAILLTGVWAIDGFVVLRQLEKAAAELQS